MIQQMQEIVLSNKVEIQKRVVKSKEGVKEQIHEIFELMKNLSLNLLKEKGQGRFENGYGKGGVPS